MSIKVNWDLALEIIVSRMTEELKRRCPVNNGELRQSISYKIIGERVDIYAVPYWEWVEQGTQPHMPPVDALKDWCKNKWGDENLAWALANHIKIYGTKPAWFVRDMLEQELIGIVSEAMKVPGVITVK